MKRIVILGAGISGLALGWFLNRRYGSRINLTILEKSSRPGGWIETVHEGGFLFEQGPRSCRSRGSGIETLKLLEQLNMQDEAIAADSSVQSRYLWRKNKLHRLPGGLFSFLFSPYLFKAASACLRDLFAAPSKSEDESIYEFVRRRFGQKIAEELIDPLAAGIYAGNIKELSVKSCFSHLHEWEKQEGSVLKGIIKRKRSKSHSASGFIQEFQKIPIFSLKRGMGSLIEELAFRLDSQILYSAEVKRLSCNSKHASIELADGTSIEADHLYSAIPAASLAFLFEGKHRELAGMLSSIPSASVAVVNLGYHRKVLKRRGFGYLIPSCEKEKILGVLWDSCIFPQQNQIPEETRLTVMIGGVRMQNFDSYSEEEFKILAKNKMHSQLGISIEPNACLVKRARCAIPQYCVGHASKVSNIKNILSRIFPKLTLHGNSFSGISVNDSIAASKLLEETSQFYP